jgi:hypothetical protein
MSFTEGHLKRTIYIGTQANSEMKLYEHLQLKNNFNYIHGKKGQKSKYSFT